MKFACVICRKIFEASQKDAAEQMLTCSSECLKAILSLAESRRREDTELESAFVPGGHVDVGKTDAERAREFLENRDDKPVLIDTKIGQASSDMTTARALLEAASKIGDFEVIDCLIALAVARLTRVRTLLGGGRPDLPAPDVLPDGDGVGEEAAGKEGEESDSL